jgi:hypothetical protein
MPSSHRFENYSVFKSFGERQGMVCNARLGSYKNENDFWKTRLACYQAVWAATKLALGSSSSQVR